MSTELKDKSVPELLDTATELVTAYRLLLEKILGSTSEEFKETQEVLEGFTPADIREAVKIYKRRHPK